MNRLLLAALFVTSLPAVAAPKDDPPWAEGVSKEKRDRAETAWNAANALLLQKSYAAAVEKYRAALAEWDHPKIELNLAMTLINLERYLDASDALAAALRYGADPYSPDDYNEALNYKKLVDARIGYLEVTCTQRDVAVSLDGKPWFACPGIQKQRVVADEHAITGERAGFLTVQRRIPILGGKTVRESLSLAPLAAAVRYEYPTRRWIPWTVAGGGAAVALVGGLVWFQATRDMDDVEKDFRTECPMGCPLATKPSIENAHDSAERRGTIGVVTVSVGGAIALGGVVWAIVNRPQRVTPTVSASPTGEINASVRVSF